MAIVNRSTRHKNTEILAILDEARTEVSTGEVEKAKTLIEVARAFQTLLSTNTDGFISERIIEVDPE